MATKEVKFNFKNGYIKSSELELEPVLSRVGLSKEELKSFLSEYRVLQVKEIKNEATEEESLRAACLEAAFNSAFNYALDLSAGVDRDTGDIDETAEGFVNESYFDSIDLEQTLKETEQNIGAVRKWASTVQFEDGPTSLHCKMVRDAVGLQTPSSVWIGNNSTDFGACIGETQRHTLKSIVFENGRETIDYLPPAGQLPDDFDYSSINFNLFSYETCFAPAANKADENREVYLTDPDTGDQYVLMLLSSDTDCDGPLYAAHSVSYLRFPKGLTKFPYISSLCDIEVLDLSQLDFIPEKPDSYDSLNETLFTALKDNNGFASTDVSNMEPANQIECPSLSSWTPWWPHRLNVPTDDLKSHLKTRDLTQEEIDEGYSYNLLDSDSTKCYVYPPEFIDGFEEKPYSIVVKDELYDDWVAVWPDFEDHIKRASEYFAELKESISATE